MQDRQTSNLNNLNKLKVAIVHDFLTQYGGAEKVLEAIAELFPDSPIYTLLWDKEKMHGKLSGRKIIPSYLQKLPGFLRKRYQWLTPILPVIPETFDLREYDVVITSSGAWSKGIVTRLNTIHVAYVHSPMRYVWDENEKYFQEEGWRLRFFIRLFFSYLRIWDKLAAERPDFLIANSRFTQKRIAKYYRRESVVIYPPAVIENNLTEGSLLKNNLQGEKYFLSVARLSPYKKMYMLVEAFNKLNLPLIIVGEGKQFSKLKKMAKKNIRILGWQGDEKLQALYREARAFVFPSVDDFGIAPIEAMSFGVPVIAYRKGGAMETVREGVTGEFFDTQTTEMVVDGVRRFIRNENSYDREEIKAQAQKFSKAKFQESFGDFMNSVLQNK